MAGKKQTHKGNYVPKNPEKYIGTNTANITYRSSWEYSVMTYFDHHPNVIAWSSECVSIPYRNPLTGRQTVYVPDFLVVYEANGKKQAGDFLGGFHLDHLGLLKEGAKKLTKRDRLAQILNAAKWQAAAAFCAKRNIRFRVITEQDLFVFKRKK